MITDKPWIVVGAGLAGCCVALELRDRGADVALYDDPNGHKATARAAGVINPVTGRRFVKTWKAQSLLRKAREFYSKLSATFEHPLITNRKILHALDSPYMEENWTLRSGDEGYALFMGGVHHNSSHVLKPERFAEVLGALQLDVRVFLERAHALFAQEHRLHKERLNYDLAHQWDSSVVFCEGHGISKNTYFNSLPNTVAKGEALVVSIPELQTDYIVKNGIVIVPYRAEGQYWVGSTYEWDNYIPSPTESGRQKLELGLKSTLTTPFQVVDHLAGIRPTTRDRRPFVGRHPEYSNLFVVNGLGAKGASLAPYCAAILCDHVESQTPFPSEVDILRYWR